MDAIVKRIAEELNVRGEQIQSAITLLDEGATVPFIARYRKEVTGALTDTDLRTLEERLRYLRELEERRGAILASIEEQGKLTAELQQQIISADTKSRLEDLYLPYKTKRRTKGQIAREQGLEPLALGLLNDPSQDPEFVAKAFVNADSGIADTAAALEGARYILMEQFAENADVLARLRDYLGAEGLLKVSLVDGKAQEGAKYQDYFDYTEALPKVPSHRALAVFRGRNEGVLNARIVVPDEPESRLQPHPAEGRMAVILGIADRGRPGDAWLKDVIRWTWRVKLYPSLETDLFTTLREKAETVAIDVFASNLKDLLLAAPAGQKVTMGLDPGLRTGVKVAVVDATGKLLAHTTVFPHAPQNQWRASLQTLGELCHRHQVQLISIGNGTASRETDKLAGELLKLMPDLRCQKVMVSEAGASVYSASAFAAQEFPDLDVTFRGAVSIARRLQDPLAELVKIEPKAIGVGQYQHDVSQVQLSRMLDAVVEDCVNAVGVDVNTASVPLLARVSGLNQSIAQQIVTYRDGSGAFAERSELLKVPRLGAKTFEQSAGFLRIVGGKNPLDASAVHPEAYALVQRIAERNQRALPTLIGDSGFLRGLKPKDYQDERFGELTVKDVLSELDKPGRDPRPSFKVAEYTEGVDTIKDLREGMILEGTVSNVTPFGAFVDIGVHQDGLVHVSALSHQFVKDPRDVVKAGDIVKVKVITVDVGRSRIGLSMRLDDPVGAEAVATGARGNSAPQERGRQSGGRRDAGRAETAGAGAGAGAGMGSLGALLLQAQKKQNRS
ncbi:MAG: RNA-binding transcriptional accessory protein [Hahellaceae bacterium]|nr:RNA-binding transcriptional accessory protein [Hahellaceae bacterium]